MPGHLPGPVVDCSAIVDDAFVTYGTRVTGIPLVAPCQCLPVTNEERPGMIPGPFFYDIEVAQRQLAPELKKIKPWSHTAA